MKTNINKIVNAIPALNEISRNSLTYKHRTSIKKCVDLINKEQNEWQERINEIIQKKYSEVKDKKELDILINKDEDIIKEGNETIELDIDYLVNENLLKDVVISTLNDLTLKNLIVIEVKPKVEEIKEGVVIK